MRNIWCAILSFLFITASFSACENSTESPPSEYPDLFTPIMESADEYPQLSKDEFIEITNHYLSTSQWSLPPDKACFYTSGINHSAYIINGEYLFSLIVTNKSDGSAEYEFCLSHYVDGVVAESEKDPSLFEEFIK